MKLGNPLFNILCRTLFLLVPGVIFLNSVDAQCPAASPLVINSVTPTESRCQASGTATVLASGGSTPYTYSITSGPVTAPAQSSNVLQSLAPGTYTVQVTDNCNTSVTSSFTIAGSYTIPAPTFTTQAPSCSSSSDGSLTVSVANGRAPLTYSLISPSPVTAGPQTDSVFSGLSSGTYTCVVTDSCGNFQTRTVTVPPGNSGSINMTFYGSILNWVSCDNYSINLNLSGDNKPPFTISVTLPNGTTLTQVLSSLGNVSIPFTYHHVAGNVDPISITVSNNCGASSSTVFDLSNYQDMTTSVSAPSGCDTAYIFTFDKGNDNDPAYRCATQTYTLISPTGVVLATQTNNSSFSGFPPGSGYKVIRAGCCLPDTLTFNWPSFTPVSVEFYFTEYFGSCNDGTTALWIYLQNASTTTGNIIITSGPASVTLADGTVHTYTYPDNIPVNFNFGNVTIGGFTAGTYHAYIEDACGYGDSTIFYVYPYELRQDAFTATPIKGCPGTPQINLNANTNAGGIFQIAAINVNSSQVATIVNSPYSGSVSGLSPGTYAVSYNLQAPPDNQGYLSGMDSYACDVITDTVVVPAYNQPQFSATPAVANCGSSRDVALLPDSADGIAPYTFQIIGGPTTTAAQASPVFPGLAAGTYTFQESDVCGNSYSSNITIDTLAVPNVTTNGGACAGGTATFSLPASPFYSYTWRHPNGSTTTGDSLSFNPVTSADTGVYTITVSSSVGGCTSSSSKAIDLGLCAVLDEALLNFRGQWNAGKVLLSWQSGDGTGIRYYTVERSTDGISFTSIGEVEAVDVSPHTYTATDTWRAASVVYYRLQIVGIAGGVQYSQIISFDGGNAPIVNVYPRSVVGNTPVRCVYPISDGNAVFRVVGVDGRVWQTVTLAAGTTQTTISVAGLPVGNYFMVYTTKDNVVPMEIWKD